MAALGTGFLAQLVLANLLGADGYGRFSYAFVWQSACVLLATAGFYNALLRFPAAYRAEGRWAELRGVIQFGERVAFVSGAAIAIAGGGVAWAVLAGAEQELMLAFLVAFAIVPLAAVLRVRCSAIRSFGQVVAAIGLDIPLREATVLVLATLFLLLSPESVSAWWPMAFMLVATVAGLLLSRAILRNRCLAPIPDVSPTRLSGIWLRTALPMLVIELTKMLMRRVDVLVVGLLLGTTEAGVYLVAVYLADLVTVPLIAIGFMFAPAIASLHSTGDRDRLQRATTTTSRWSAVCGLGLALPLIAFAEVPLLFFGPEFESGAAALRILAAGAVFSSMMGAIEFLIMMTGNERTAAMTYSIAVIVVVVLNVVLIPLYGLAGAAIASAAVAVTSKAGLAHWLRRTAGILAGPARAISTASRRHQP